MNAVPVTHAVDQEVLHWIKVAMVVGIVLALLATYFVYRLNKRLDRERLERLARRRAEAEVREAAIDALSGRRRLESPKQSIDAGEDL